MFGYIKKSKVLEIIDNGVEQLSEKRRDILLNISVKNEKEKMEFEEALNKLSGGIHFLICLKKHFK